MPIMPIEHLGTCAPLITPETCFTGLLSPSSDNPHLVTEIEQNLCASGELISNNHIKVGVPWWQRVLPSSQLNIREETEGVDDEHGSRPLLRTSSRAFTPTISREGRRWLSLDPGSPKPPDLDRTVIFSNEHQFKVVSKVVETPVSQITSFKAMFKALEVIMTALEILHRTGWIHRDLILSNIYLHNDDRKLSGLGHAKEHADSSRYEVRTGTAHFMAFEVECQAYEWALGVPFRSNGLHDIESSLWIAIWMIFFSITSASDEPPAPGTDISRQLVAAQQVLYQYRSRIIVEGNRIFANKLYDLNPSVAFISPFLLKARDSVARHHRIVGGALEEGTVNIQALYISVYNDVRTMFQQISDAASPDFYLHFIAKNPSFKRKESDGSAERSQTEDRASQAVDEIPSTKKRRKL